MRRLQLLREIIAPVIRSRGWNERIARERVLLQWERTVGEVTAAHAQARRMDGRVLIIETDSPTWSHTLSMMKPNIIKRLREDIPDAQIRDLRFVCADSARAREGHYKVSWLKRGRRPKKV